VDSVQGSASCVVSTASARVRLRVTADAPSERIPVHLRDGGGLRDLSGATA